MENKRIPQKDIERWTQRLQNVKPSQALREIACTYEADRPDLAMMIGDLFVGISVTEVQLIWHWNLSGKGRGLGDEEIDQAFEKLTIQKK